MSKQSGPGGLTPGTGSPQRPGTGSEPNSQDVRIETSQGKDWAFLSSPRSPDCGIAPETALIGVKQTWRWLTLGRCENATAFTECFLLFGWFLG